ncbi:MAG: beta-propeller domain-containing protein [Methanobacteriota archaeon]
MWGKGAVGPVAVVIAVCVSLSAMMVALSHEDARMQYYPVYVPVYPSGASAASGGETRSIDLFDGAAINSTGLETFESFDEMGEYIGNAHYYYQNGGYYEMDRIDQAAPSGALSFSGLDSAAGSGEPNGATVCEVNGGYSVTNVQVAGVDEGDVLKNDGEFAYLITPDGGSVQVVRVGPAAEAGMLCAIDVTGQAIELYLDGDRLVIVEQAYYFEGGISKSSYAYSNEPILFVSVYDVSNASAPSLVKTVRTDGQYVTSRVVGDRIYLIGEVSLYGIENETDLPAKCAEIYHVDGEGGDYRLTEFAVVNLSAPEREPSVLHVVMAGSNNVLFTLGNIYITYTEREYNNANYWGSSSSEMTVVHRLSVEGDGISYAARGEAEGSLLNRYCMDEHGGHLRLATTSGWMSESHVTVLDMGMETVGKVDDIAPGERIYSARFIGDRGYVVTFRQVDPLFVIDLSDPEEPTVLGELKIPGYSTYLHPYDENHIIGIGKDAVDSENGDFAWYQGVKIALFDVGDASDPKEVDSIVVGDRGSESAALYDPHAFLFDPERSQLTVPMEVYEGGNGPYGYGDMWYGAYVFNITPEGGIKIAGKISHNVEAETQYDYSYGYHQYNAYNPVRRSFYIGDTMYTVSNMMLKGTSLADFSELCSVDLP